MPAPPVAPPDQRTPAQRATPPDPRTPRPLAMTADRRTPGPLDRQRRPRFLEILRFRATAPDRRTPGRSGRPLRPAIPATPRSSRSSPAASTRISSTSWPRNCSAPTAMPPRTARRSAASSSPTRSPCCPGPAGRLAPAHRHPGRTGRHHQPPAGSRSGSRYDPAPPAPGRHPPRPALRRPRLLPAPRRVSRAPHDSPQQRRPHQAHRVDLALLVPPLDRGPPVELDNHPQPGRHHDHGQPGRQSCLPKPQPTIRHRRLTGGCERMAQGMSVASWSRSDRLFGGTFEHCAVGVDGDGEWGAHGSGPL